MEWSVSALPVDGDPSYIVPKYLACVGEDLQDATGTLRPPRQRLVYLYSIQLQKATLMVSSVARSTCMFDTRPP